MERKIFEITLVIPPSSDPITFTKDYILRKKCIVDIGFIITIHSIVVKNRSINFNGKISTTSMIECTSLFPVIGEEYLATVKKVSKDGTIGEVNGKMLVFIPGIQITTNTITVTIEAIKFRHVYNCIGKMNT
jgi:hypothetical protein